jgi:plastocyanin
MRGSKRESFLDTRSKNMKMRGLRTISALFVCCAGASLAKPAFAAGENPATTVVVDNFSFNPPRLSIPVGATVTWQNHDDMPHTIVNQDTPREFKSPPLDSDEQFSYTFSKPGTYTYFCSIHPKMTGVVVVK